MDGLPPEALAQVADYFRTLAEPARLQILNLLRGGERNVGELAELTGYSIANVSRHLSHLGREGFVLRESRGNSAYYRIADESIYALCDMVCGRISQRWSDQAAQGAAFAAAATRPTATRRAPLRSPPKA
ncbi:MAG: helix-turn-helix transcriptional regulator [Burkholderiales bacterium]|nr:helix-turn-helix transcriptional regulator [Burkholderiales bacterium]